MNSASLLLRVALLLVALLGSGLSGHAGAADLLSEVAARVQPVPVLRGHFTQERELAGFSKALRSSGQFVAARGHGVLWRTEQPFPALLVITADSIRERVDGSDSFALDAEREPALRQINRILLALLQGEVEVLREQFAVDGRADGSGWTLQLTPLAQVTGLIGQISVAGDTQVQRVEIREAGGDVSRVVFSELSGAAGDLSPAELAAFD
jgi:outer membrane lipoprotein-sorting protein